MSRPGGPTGPVAHVELYLLMRDTTREGAAPGDLSPACLAGDVKSMTGLMP